MIDSLDFRDFDFRHHIFQDGRPIVHVLGIVSLGL